MLVLRSEVLERLAVEGDDREARRLPRRDRLHVLRRARQAVLGPEEDAHVEPRGEERLRGGDEVERDGGGVAEEAEAPARMRGASSQKDVQAGLEAAHACESSGSNVL